MAVDLDSVAAGDRSLDGACALNDLCTCANCLSQRKQAGQDQGEGFHGEERTGSKIVRF